MTAFYKTFGCFITCVETHRVWASCVFPDLRQTLIMIIRIQVYQQQETNKQLDSVLTNFLFNSMENSEAVT